MRGGKIKLETRSMLKFKLVSPSFVEARRESLDPTPPSVGRGDPGGVDHAIWVKALFLFWKMYEE